MRPEQVKKMLKAAFPEAQVEVHDMTGTGDHFEISVACKSFADKPLVQQHLMVHKALEGEMDRGIHAVQIKTRSL